MVLPPIRIEVTRGRVVEHRHEVVAAAVDINGAFVLQRGNTSVVTPTRSTVKLLQALPLVRSGAADTFQVSDIELALACGSHNGQPVHCSAVEAWLGRLNLDSSALHCGDAIPLLPDIAARFLASGQRPSPLVHNCSGKHAGFLTVVSQRGDDPARYLERTSPVQTMVLDAVAEASGVGVSDLLVEMDGCGAPVTCLKVSALARAIAHVLRAGPGSAEARLLNAMAGNAQMVAGPGRLDTQVAELTASAVLTKAGADGVHVAYVRSLGVGVAVKALDGERVSAEIGLLEAVSELDNGLAELLQPLRTRAVFNDQGQSVGVAQVDRRASF